MRYILGNILIIIMITSCTNTMVIHFSTKNLKMDLSDKILIFPVLIKGEDDFLLQDQYETIYANLIYSFLKEKFYSNLVIPEKEELTPRQLLLRENPSLKLLDEDIVAIQNKYNPKYILLSSLIVSSQRGITEKVNIFAHVYIYSVEQQTIVKIESFHKEFDNGLGCVSLTEEIYSLLLKMMEHDK